MDHELPVTREEMIAELEEMLGPDEESELWEHRNKILTEQDRDNIRAFRLKMLSSMDQHLSPSPIPSEVERSPVEKQNKAVQKEASQKKTAVDSPKPAAVKRYSTRSADVLVNPNCRGTLPTRLKPSLAPYNPLSHRPTAEYAILVISTKKDAHAHLKVSRSLLDVLKSWYGILTPHLVRLAGLYNSLMPAITGRDPVSIPSVPPTYIASESPPIARMLSQTRARSGLSRSKQLRLLRICCRGVSFSRFYPSYRHRIPASSRRQSSSFKVSLKSIPSPHLDSSRDVCPSFLTDALIVLSLVSPCICRTRRSGSNCVEISQIFDLKLFSNLGLNPELLRFDSGWTRFKLSSSVDLSVLYSCQSFLGCDAPAQPWHLQLD
ncbi:hypothetical protein B0H16DRAFT_1703806 [Mycena metata]|uniref:Uncharacterized protein n=1 Tax=Mycena metata TaxID=1033252 RepID=A0AAD7H0B3_9AGAR|nr:hypothetical protein B0H16DRAFT_1703806 [Mycena metata]